MKGKKEIFKFWDTERLTNLLKVTQLVSSKAGIRTRQASSKVQASNHCTVYQAPLLGRC